MGTEVTDTSRVAAAKKPVTVGSQRLRVPASPPLRFMFLHGTFIRKLSAGDADDHDIETYYGEVLDFLRRYNPKVSEEKLLTECSLTDLLTFYRTWWSGDDADEEDGDGEARPPQRRGTTGGKRTTSKSRS